MTHYLNQTQLILKETYIPIEKFNSYFMDISTFNLLFNQLSSLSANMANITVLQQFGDTSILSASFAEIFIKENLFSFIFAIVITASYGKLYSDSSTRIFQTIAKAVQVALYISLLFLIHFIFNNNYFGISTNFFEILLLTILLFLSLIMVSTNLISIKSFETPLLIYVVASFGWVLLNTSDLALFIICIEGFSLTLYVLATTSRTFGGIMAAVKYFAFGTLGSLMLYWGAVNMFEIIGSMNMLVFMNVTSHDKSIWIQSLILSGLLIKLGAAPFHQWVADVYSGVQTLVTAFYSTFVKFVLFLLFVQFAISFISTNDIEYVSFLSLIIGSFITLRQTDIKRFLAWGSITHTGYLLAGDLMGSYIYVLTYILASILFFSVLLLVTVNGKEAAYISDLRFIGKSAGAQRIIILCVLASMAGLPPFAGFYGKFFVWSSLLEDSYLYNDSWSFILFLAGTLTSLIVMFYYVYIMYTLFASDESIYTATVSSAVTDSQFSGYLTNLNSSIKYAQYFGSGLTVLLTFILCNLLFIIW